MPKKQPKKNNQYYPFVIGSDRDQPFIAYTGDPAGEIPWRELAKGIRRHLGKDSMVLKILVSEYRRKAKSEGIDAALTHFWTHQGKLSLKILNEDMRLVLIEASKGITGATQIIVRACPEAIHLPFIASNMATILQKHKYSKVGKRQDGRDLYVEDEEVTVCDESIKDIRHAWDAFLPKRTGGDLPYANEDLKRIVKKARQQKTSNERDLYGEIGKALNISSEAIKKKVKIKEGRGRPQK